MFHLVNVELLSPCKSNIAGSQVSPLQGITAFAESICSCLPPVFGKTEAAREAFRQDFSRSVGQNLWRKFYKDFAFIGDDYCSILFTNENDMPQIRRWPRVLRFAIERLQ